jgi:hypothetical protein
MKLYSKLRHFEFPKNFQEYEDGTVPLFPFISNEISIPTLLEPTKKGYLIKKK